MAHQIGSMFYVGDVPWHGLGKELAARPDLEGALKAGRLDWTVSKAPLALSGEPQSEVAQRVAVVRDDREPGEPGRVLGVVHRDFSLLQNREGMELFDSLFGRGLPVYETGGYLREGEVVWLQAALSKSIRVQPDDELMTYLLFSNSHDGSRPIDIRLTTVRVVCNNTLSLALRSGSFGSYFRRGHSQSLEVLKAEAEMFFGRLLAEQHRHQDAMVQMSKANCDDEKFKEFLLKLLPDPKAPATTKSNLAAAKAFETRLASIQQARAEITDVRKYGCPQRLRDAVVPPADRTWWGALNSVTAWVDHVQEIDGDPFAHQMFGAGDDLKTKAYRDIAALVGAA